MPDLALDLDKLETHLQLGIVTQLAVELGAHLAQIAALFVDLAKGGEYFLAGGRLAAQARGKVVEAQLAVLEVFAPIEQVLAAERAGKRCLDDALLTLLDGARQAHLALAVEEAFLTHLPEVDLDRIRAVGAVSFVRLRAGAGAAAGSDARVVFLKVDGRLVVEHLDVHILNEAGHRATVRAPCGQDLVQLVIGDVAALLAQLDQIVDRLHAVFVHQSSGQLRCRSPNLDLPAAR